MTTRRSMELMLLGDDDMSSSSDESDADETPIKQFVNRKAKPSAAVAAFQQMFPSPLSALDTNQMEPLKRQKHAPAVNNKKAVAPPQQQTSTTQALTTHATNTAAKQSISMNTPTASNRFVYSTKFLLKYLATKDRAMHLRAKAVIAECIKRHKLNVTGYQHLQACIHWGLCQVVSQEHWNYVAVQLARKLRLAQEHVNQMEALKRPAANNNKAVAPPQQQTSKTQARTKHTTNTAPVDAKQSTSMNTPNMIPASDRFVYSTKFLLKYLATKDRAMHLRAKAVIAECIERYNQKVAGYEHLSACIHWGLCQVVSQEHWYYVASQLARKYASKQQAQGHVNQMEPFKRQHASVANNNKAVAPPQQQTNTAATQQVVHHKAAPPPAATVQQKPPFPLSAFDVNQMEPLKRQNAPAVTYKKARAPPAAMQQQNQALNAPVVDKELFVCFTNSLLRYLLLKDRTMHDQATAVIEECTKRSKQKVAGYEKLFAIVEQRLRQVVSQEHWNFVAAQVAYVPHQSTAQSQMQEQVKKRESSFRPQFPEAKKKADYKPA